MSVKKLCFSVCIYRVRSILLLSINFLPINKIILMILRHHILWQNSTIALISSNGGLISDHVVFVECHGHWWSLIALNYHASHSSNIMLIIVHFKDFLLLSCQVLWHAICGAILILLTIHCSKTHWARDKYVVLSIGSIVAWCFELILMHEVVSMMRWVALYILILSLIKCLQMLKLILLRILITVISDITSSLLTILNTTKCTLLIMTIQFLNVEATSSLMITKSSISSSFQCLILGSGTALSM